MQRSHAHPADPRPAGGVSTSDLGWHAVDAPGLSDIVKTLGPSVAHLVGGDDRSGHSVSTLVLYDPLTDVRRVESGFLLAIGVLPRGEQWRDLLKTAGDRGYVGVAVKPSGVTRQELLDSMTNSGLRVVALADEVSWERLITLVSSMMHHSYSAEQTLGNTRLGDLFTLANTIARAVGGAVAIVDPQQFGIAYSTIDGQPTDKTRQNSILDLRVPSTPATAVEYRTVHGASDVVEISASNSDYPRLAVPIRAGGELLGSVWAINETGSADEASKAELRRGADIAALLLLQARTEGEVFDRRRGDTFSAVLDDPTLAIEASASLEIPPCRRIRIVAIGICEQSLRKDTTAAYHQMLGLVRLHCRAEVDLSAATVRSDLLYLLLPAGNHDGDRNSSIRLLGGIDAHARRSYGYRLVIGVGGVVSGLAEARKSMVQAGRVVKLMRRDLTAPDQADGGALIGFSESFTARLALLALAEHVADLNDAAGHTIATMREYDSANTSDYVPTLKAFFGAHGNISDMAQILHVHANTCRYRLSRIASVFDIDLDDRDTRLVLWLQLRLDELID